MIEEKIATNKLFNWHSIFIVCWGYFYIILGIVDYWEGGKPEPTYWFTLITPIFGVIYIVSGYLLRKGAVSVLLLLIPIIISRTIIFDFVLRLTIQNKTVNIFGIIFTLAWVYLILLLRKDIEDNHMA